MPGLPANYTMAELSEAAARRPVADSFLGGRLLLHQPAEGHRCGTDAVLLAAAVPADFSGHVIDAGAGIGAAGLALANTRPRSQVGLVEIDPFVASLARANIVQNGLIDRCYAAEADLFSPAGLREAGVYSERAGLVITNPPFLDPGKSRLSPEPNRRRAHAMQTNGPSALGAWIAASLALVVPSGLYIMIHRPDMLPVILQSLDGCTGAITVLPVYPRLNSKARRILVRAKKGSRAPFALAPPLVLHDEHGFTPAADAIHRGKSAIEW
jgi:tRNA1(Val) A37 N6-methylase TrmN6